MRLAWFGQRLRSNRLTTHQANRSNQRLRTLHAL